MARCYHGCDKVPDCDSARRAKRAESGACIINKTDRASGGRESEYHYYGLQLMDCILSAFFLSNTMLIISLPMAWNIFLHEKSLEPCSLPFPFTFIFPEKSFFSNTAIKE